jgi:hypothetical protein
MIQKSGIIEVSLFPAGEIKKWSDLKSVHEETELILKARIFPACYCRRIGGYCAPIPDRDIPRQGREVQLSGQPDHRTSHLFIFFGTTEIRCFFYQQTEKHW